MEKCWKMLTDNLECILVVLESLQVHLEITVVVLQSAKEGNLCDPQEPP